MNATEYDMLYHNLRAVDSSSEEEDEYEEDEPEQNMVKHRKHIFNFVIDTTDRNWVGNDIDTFNFQVKFGGDSDTFETYQKTVIIRNSDDRPIYIWRAPLKNIFHLNLCHSL